MEPKEYQTMFEVEDVHWWYVGLRRLIYDVLERLFPSEKNLDILDAGCGTGALLEMLRAYGHATGIDIFREALSFARRRGLKQLGCGSVLDLPFGTEKFDVVTSIDVLYHLRVADDAQALREFHRVLKRKGILILNLPAYHFLMSRHDRAIHTKRRYTRKDLGRKLAAVGFQLKHLTYRNTLLFPPVLFVRFMEKRRTDVKSDLKQCAPLVNRLLLSILLLENRMLRAMRLPFGSSVFCIAQKAAKRDSSGDHKRDGRKKIQGTRNKERGCASRFHPIETLIRDYDRTWKRSESMPEEVRRLYAHLNVSVRVYASLRWRLCPFEVIERYVPESGVMLDVGCGYGLLSNLIAVRGKDRHVTGVDLSSKRIRGAQSTVQGRRNIRFVEQDVNDLVLESCDAVIMSDVLHHIPLDVAKRLLVKISEKLVQGGMLIIQDVDSTPRWKSWVAFGIDRILNIGKELYHRPRTELHRVLEDVGFCVESYPVHKGFPLSDVLFLCKKRNVKRET